MPTLFSESGNSLSYFALDGTYGDGEGMVIANTDEWTNEMWLYISEASDYDRAYIAECFENGHSIAEVTEMVEEQESMFRPVP